MIEIKNIKKSFDGSTIIQNISTTFEKGKTNLIIGQSGSGKTVLLKCLLGLHEPDSGEILWIIVLPSKDFFMFLISIISLIIIV